LFSAFIVAVANELDRQLAPPHLKALGLLACPNFWFMRQSVGAESGMTGVFITVDYSHSACF
jgi:hypothetical protein